MIGKKRNKDKRIYYVSLTEKGRDYIAHIFPKHKEFLNNLFKDLSEEDKRELVENLINFRKVLK